MDLNAPLNNINKTERNQTMRTLKNVVAVDWRSGKDRYYFFFKDTETYTRIDAEYRNLPDGYPASVNSGNWDSFHSDVKNLRFGFSTTNIYSFDGQEAFDRDYLMLFYYKGETPMCCWYDQDDDKVTRRRPVADTHYRPILPYFDRIVAATWWESFGVNWIGKKSPVRFLMNDGHTFMFDMYEKSVRLEPIDERTWPGLAPYKDRILTGVQNDRTLAESLFHIFLTDNEFMTYTIPNGELVHGPEKVDENSWPGLLRD
jgi:hypothetical protein